MKNLIWNEYKKIFKFIVLILFFGSSLSYGMCEYDLNTQNKYSGRTTLISAANIGDLDMVNLLLQKGVNTNIRDKIGWTALMYAVEKGYVEIVKSLLNHGASIEIKDNSGKSVMFQLMNVMGCCDEAEKIIFRELGHPHFDPKVFNIVCEYADLNLHAIYYDIWALLKKELKKEALENPKKRKLDD